jgi:EAL domain-containing protein (putative c-di-GMP-specific phosphodiesterase class I)
LCVSAFQSFTPGKSDRLLGKRLIRETCEFINELREDGLTEQKIAVNISGIQLLEIDFVSDLVGIVDSYGIDHNQLELELTESVFFENFEQLNQVISELSHQNFSLALDDFGTGYSSLARLKEVDVHIIKIDKLFVKNILKQNRDTLLLPDIISMIHKLGLTVVAEGVEHPEQVSFLADHDCDIIQGYYYGKPMKKEDAKRFLQNWKSR